MQLTCKPLNFNAGKMPKRLNNGLTFKQVEKAKILLSKVNRVAVCERVGVKVATVDNVLRDKSPRVADLNKVLEEAKKEVKQKECAVKAFPL